MFSLSNKIADPSNSVLNWFIDTPSILVAICEIGDTSPLISRVVMVKLFQHPAAYYMYFCTVQLPTATWLPVYIISDNDQDHNHT